MSADLDSKGLEAAFDDMPVERDGGYEGIVERAIRAYLTASGLTDRLKDAEKRNKRLEQENGQIPAYRKALHARAEQAEAERDALAAEVNRLQTAVDVGEDRIRNLKADNAAVKVKVSNRAIENIAGKLTATAGIAPSSSDGFTYLNDVARALLDEAAQALRAALSNQSTASLKVEGLEQCPECGGRTFAIVDGRKPDGSYGPGPERRCVECKRVSQPAEGQRESGEASDALDHLRPLLEEARRVYEAAEKAGVKVEIGHYRRLRHGLDLLEKLSATPPAPQPLEGAVKVKAIETAKLARDVASRMIEANIQWRLDPSYIIELCDEIDRLSALSAPAGDGWRLVPCKCHTEEAKRLCMVKDECSTIEACASPYQGDGR